MPFQKSVPTSFGMPASYWKLDAVQDNYRPMTVDIALAGYLTADAADPISRWNITLPVTATRLPDSAIEDLLASQPFWQDATRIPLTSAQSPSPTVATATAAAPPSASS